MVDFIKPRRKRPFRERIQIIGQLLNEKGEVTVKELVLKWGIVPHYARTLLQWAKEFYPYAEYDDAFQCLYIPERRRLEIEAKELKADSDG